MSKVVRSVKNVTKGYSSVQVKVRNGTWEHLYLRPNVEKSCTQFSPRWTGLLLTIIPSLGRWRPFVDIMGTVNDRAFANRNA